VNTSAQGKSVSISLSGSGSFFPLNSFRSVSNSIPIDPENDYCCMVPNQNACLLQVGASLRTYSWWMTGQSMRLQQPCFLYY